jgi:hypothetical protein
MNKGFTVDPDPVFYINKDADADPEPRQTLKSQTVGFLHEKYSVLELLKVGIMPKNKPKKVEKPF